MSLKSCLLQCFILERNISIFLKENWILNILRLDACVHVCVFRLLNSLICCFRALGNRIHTSNLKRDHLIEKIINWRQVYSLSEGIEENSNNPLAWRDSTWWRKTIGVRNISNTDLEFTGESVTGPIGWQDSSLNSSRTKLVMASWQGLLRRNWFQRLPPGSSKTFQRAVQLDLLNTHR